MPQKIDTPEKLKLVAPPSLFTSKEHAERLLKEMPMNEFLQVVEQASPEELEALIQTAHHLPRPPEKNLSIVRRFFNHLTQVPDGERSAGDIVGWWESRRITFNVLVGLCGILSLIVGRVSHVAPTSTLIDFAFAYGVGANLCYTLGWMGELTVRHILGERARNAGPALFTLGIIFSLMLTLFPAVISILIYIGHRL